MLTLPPVTGVWCGVWETQHESHRDWEYITLNPPSDQVAVLKIRTTNTIEKYWLAPYGSFTVKVGFPSSSS
jgi:hypothetical protein